MQIWNLNGVDWLVETFLNVGHAFEIGGRVGAILRCVEHFVLSGQIVERIDRRVETGNGKESGQVSSIRSDDDETKQPPGGGNKTTWQVLRRLATTLVSKFICFIFNFVNSEFNFNFVLEEWAMSCRTKGLLWVWIHVSLLQDRSSICPYYFDTNMATNGQKSTAKNWKKTH